MTPQEKQQLKTLFVAMSMYYGQEIPDPALKLYVEDLDDLPFEAVVSALKELRRDPKITRCPMPASVRDRVSPEISVEGEAIYLANLIYEAIAHCGPYANPTLPPVAAQIVRMEGGWASLCESVTYDNAGTHKAQWRMLAKSLIERNTVREKHLELEDSSDMAKFLPNFLKEMPKDPSDTPQT